MISPTDAEQVAAFCLPWRLRGCFDAGEDGRVCCFCHRAIAAPQHAKGKPVACIYCGLDRGLIAEELES